MSLTFLRQMSYGLNYVAYITMLQVMAPISDNAAYELAVTLSWWAEWAT